MGYRYWQAGLHIQQNVMVCVALQRKRGGWALKRWWQFETDPEITAEERIVILRRWRREMPLQHSVSIALPAAGTVQKRLPSPQMVLRESEQAQWIVNTVAQQLETPPAMLAFDYRGIEENIYSVIAARRQDVERLEKLARAAGMHIRAVTPDASALQNYFPWLPPGQRGLSWFDGHHWLWATAQGWGSSPEPVVDLLSCGSDQAQPDRQFDPWRCLSQLQPPLPAKGDDFTIALALALGDN